MINLFRNTRRRLADDNQFLKYSRYAVGEIILVVIGILIALQINNWNKDLQNIRLEEKILENLKIDLGVQKEIIQIQLSFERKALAEVDTCLNMVNSTIEVSTLIRLLDSLSQRQTFVTNRVTFENLGLDGNTTVIRNSDLQNEIIKYYQQLDYTTSVINNNNIYRTNSQFGTFVVNNTLGFLLDETGQPNKTYVMSQERRFTLKTQLDGRKYSSKNNIEKSILQMGKTKGLIQLIDNELKK